MTFEQYYHIMETHGIGEVFFRYDGADCAAMMHIHGLHLVYVLFSHDHREFFDDLDACVSAPIFTGGRCLRDIWDEIEILAVDGLSADEYDIEASYNYVQAIRDQGELIWSYFHGARESFWIQLKYVSFGVLLGTGWPIVYPILGLANWNIVLLFGGCGLFAFLITAFALWRNPLDMNYQITTNKIFLFNGLARDVTFSGIRNIKLRRCLWNPSRGTIYLKLKKGMSINYVLENIPEADKVYALIMERLQEVKEHGTAINE